MRREIPLAFLKAGAHHMGLRPLAAGEWLWRDERFDDEIALRRRLAADPAAGVIAALPSAADAVRELEGAIDEELAGEAGGGDAAGNALDTRSVGQVLLDVGGRVQEDLCVLAAGPDGYILEAAFVAFPMRWRLAEKIGKPLDLVHAPVPGFAERLAGPVGRHFDTLADDRPVWRSNWSITDDPDLHQPWSRGAVIDGDAAATGRLYLRVERQTLRRLPRSRRIVFTIRTFVRTLEEVLTTADRPTALADRLDELPQPVARYKNVAGIREPLVSWLRDRAERLGAAQAPTAMR